MPSVTDPVCHMQINSEDAVAKTEHQGQTYYFCADRCRVQFEQDPSRYVTGTKGEPLTTSNS
jgi:Cu+-exporting ATPase